ncbi:MAG: MT-A70 family methyltransferase [Stellaceae bacterium]
MTARHYGVILADPPWSWASYSRKGKGRSAEAHYDTMDLADIKRLPVADWAADDCALFLWGINSMLPQGFDVIDAWGFRFKTVAFTWAKRTTRDNGWHFGLGYWQNTESCLLATRGRPHRLSRAVPELIVAPRRLHSQKPEEVYERIEALCGDVPRLELFARSARPGWDRWGLESETGPSPRRWRSNSYPDVEGTTQIESAESNDRQV